MRVNSVQDINGVLDVLTELEDYLDNYVDVDDGPYGEPVPNRAMRLMVGVQDAIEVVNRLRRG